MNTSDIDQRKAEIEARVAEIRKDVARIKREAEEMRKKMMSQVGDAKLQAMAQGIFIPDYNSLDPRQLQKLMRRR